MLASVLLLISQGDIYRWAPPTIYYEVLFYLHLFSIQDGLTDEEKELVEKLRQQKAQEAKPERGASALFFTILILLFYFDKKNIVINLHYDTVDT